MEPTLHRAQTEGSSSASPLQPGWAVRPSQPNCRCRRGSVRPGRAEGRAERPWQGEEAAAPARGAAPWLSVSVPRGAAPFAARPRAP